MKRLTLLTTLAALLLVVSACGKEETPQPSLNNDGFSPRGASLARFSVSTTSQVRFSRGNLQYKASTGQWRFAPKQYDCIGVGNDKISPSNSGWIDLFGWATSGWDSGALDSMPTATSIFPAGYGPGTNHLTRNQAEADWAWHNPILYGGDTAHVWRTLTSEEWRFLLGGRPNAVEKVGVATVCDIKGLVILPDDWIPTEDVAFIPGVADTFDIELVLLNKYNASQWKHLEMNGAIFLPAGGSRRGTKTTDINRNGYYWSTSYGNETQARNIAFSATGLNIDVFTDRHYGFCVRPVFDIK